LSTFFRFERLFAKQITKIEEVIFVNVAHGTIDLTRRS